MSFRSSLLILAACSLAAGALVLGLAKPLFFSGPGASYAVLSVDASYPDRYIGALLARGGGDESRKGAAEKALEGYISESTQWVFLDDFGELREIPLDQYRERVEAFDPRNDGYAGRLRSFFVPGGERRFFIPLSRGFFGSGFKKLRAAAAEALGDVPFSLEFPGRGGPLFRYLVLFVSAAAAVLALSSASPDTAALLPLLAAAVFAGPPGFALGAVLLALGVFLRGPLGEFFIARRCGALRRIRFSPGAPLLLLLLYGGICFFGGIGPGLGLGLLAGFFGIFPLGLWAESNRGRGEAHIRFVPVQILDRHEPWFPPSPLVLPFTLASVLALLPFPTVPFPDPSPSGGSFGGEVPVGAGEYERHAAFQTAFSLLPLGGEETPDPLNQSGYLRYYLGEDGLIAGTEEFSPGLFPEGETVPPFPLEALMNFLSEEGQGGPRSAWPPSRQDIVPSCLVIFAGLPALLRVGTVRYRKMKMPLVNEKRIAA